MTLQILSLIFLAGAIVIGFVKKVNVGIVALGLAPILAMIGKLDMDVVFSGYPTKLFLTLLGTMLLFALLQENKTLELLSRKIVALVGNKAYLVPIIIYIVSFLLSAAGPGAISVQAVMILLAVSLSVQMNLSPVLLAAMALLGAVGGTVSPIALTGIIITDLLDAGNIAGSPLKIWIGVSLANFICAVFVYIFFKGYKIRLDFELKISDMGKFNLNQKIGLLGLGLLIVSVVGFDQDVGLMSFIISFVLIALNVVNQEKSIKLIPWNVIILVCGVNVLMNVALELGGIALLSNVLAGLMNNITAPFVLSLTGGVMSWFSSANGVVLPTLIPTIQGIVDTLGGNIEVVTLVTAITAGATVAGISPLSTGGSLTLAAYSQEREISAKEQQKLFAQLFTLSVVQVIIVSVISLIGVLI